MNEKKILIWDDEKDEAEAITSRVKNCIANNAWPIKIRTTFGPYIDFEKLLRDEHSNYDLLIMDCLEGRKRKKVIKNALDLLQDKNLKVIALTVDSYIVGDDYMNLGNTYHFCKPVFKAEFYAPTDQNSCENVISEALQLKKNKKGITYEIQLNLELDIFLNHLIHVLGGDEMLKLMIYEGGRLDYFTIVDNTVDIESLNQGLSGAIVLKVQYHTANQSRANRFVKISANNENLIGELLKSKNGYINHFPSEYTMPYLNNHPIKFSDYYFNIAVLFDKSTSYRNFLQKNSNSHRLLPIVKECMLNCFKKVYEVECQPSIIKNKTLSILEIFNHDRIAFLKRSTKELKLLTEDQSKIVGSLSDIIHNYNTTSEFYTNEIAKYVWTHGDLHGNNILINAKDENSEDKDTIKIIDPANIDVAHWSRDICMLIVDIFAYGIDVEEKEFYGINYISKWKEMGVLIVKNQPISNNQNNRGVVDILNWLTNIDNLKTIFPNNVFSIWEFQLSLSVEFLRMSYKQDQLPPGKRAACLLIGVEAFNIALVSFNNN
jgi:thiamine kinase-like enzyme